MQSYVEVLACWTRAWNYRHVAGRASDEKMQKLIGRNMIRTAHEINANFLTAK